MIWLRVLRLCGLVVALAASAAPWPSAHRTLEPPQGLTGNPDHVVLSRSLATAPVPSLQVARPRRPLAPGGGDPWPGERPGAVTPAPLVSPACHGPGLEPRPRTLLGTYATTLPPPVRS